MDSKKPVLKGWFPYKCVRVLPNQLNLSQDEDAGLADEFNNETDKKNEWFDFSPQIVHNFFEINALNVGALYDQIYLNWFNFKFSSCE